MPGAPIHRYGIDVAKVDRGTAPATANVALAVHTVIPPAPAAIASLAASSRVSASSATSPLRRVAAFVLRST